MRQMLDVSNTRQHEWPAAVPLTLPGAR